MSNNNFFEKVRSYLSAVDDVDLMRLLIAHDVVEALFTKGLTYQNTLANAANAVAIDHQSSVRVHGLTRDEKVDNAVANAKKINRQDGDWLYLDRKGFYKLSMSTGDILSNTAIEKLRTPKQATHDLFHDINKGELSLGCASADEVKTVFECYADWEMYLLGCGFDRSMKSDRWADYRDYDDDQIKVLALSALLSSGPFKNISELDAAIEHDTESWVANASELLVGRLIYKMEDIIARNRCATKKEIISFHQKVDFQAFEQHYELIFNQLIDECAEHIKSRIVAESHQDENDSETLGQGQ